MMYSNDSVRTSPPHVCVYRQQSATLAYSLGVEGSGLGSALGSGLGSGVGSDEGSGLGSALGGGLGSARYYYLLTTTSATTTYTENQLPSLRDSPTLRNITRKLHLRSRLRNKTAAQSHM